MTGIQTETDMRHERQQSRQRDSRQSRHRDEVLKHCQALKRSGGIRGSAKSSRTGVRKKRVGECYHLRI